MCLEESAHLLWLWAPPLPCGAWSPLPTFCVIVNEIMFASWEGAIILLHWVITLYKRRSACPAVCLPQAAHTWLGRGSCREPLLGTWLISRHGLQGGQSWVGTAPGPAWAWGPNHRRSGTSPPMPLPTQLRPGQQVGGLQALEARGGFLRMQRSRCLRGAGPSLCGRSLRPLPCSAWRTFIRAHRNGVGALEEGGRTASPCRFIS